MAPVQGIKETGELFSQTLISTWAILSPEEKVPKRLFRVFFRDDKLHTDVYIFAGNIINHYKDPY